MKTSYTDIQRRRDQLADALYSCRTLFEQMHALSFHEPASDAPSEAHDDLLLMHLGADGQLWPADTMRQPRALAVKLLHQQSDYCVSLALQVRAGEVTEPASTIARSVIEYAARIFWVLDPQAEHRARCARAFLMELVSLHHARDAANDLSDSPAFAAEKADAKARYRALVKMLKARFADVQTGTEPWSIEGERYPSWTEATAAWARANDTGVDGVSLYKLHAVLSHPQGFTATFWLSFDEDGNGVRIVEPARAETPTRLALVTFYTSMSLLANHTGHRPQVLIDWENAIENVLPGIFAEALAAAA